MNTREITRRYRLNQWLILFLNAAAVEKPSKHGVPATTSIPRRTTIG